MKQTTDVLCGNENKDRSWLYQLENYALKKQANEELFRQIGEELEVVLGDETSDDYKFTIEQLRAKFKWFKKECHTEPSAFSFLMTGFE